MAKAIRKRQDLTWYTNFCMQAASRGSRVTASFAEVFPEHAPAEETVAVPQEAAKLMERLAAEQLARLEAKHAERK